MAKPLTPEEVGQAERLVKDMRARGKKYKDLSPKGRSLLDRYRAQLKAGPGPASSPALTEPAPKPATGLDAPIERPGGRLSFLPRLATGQPFRYDYEKGEYVDEKGQPLVATKRQVVQMLAGAGLSGLGAIPGEAAAAARTGARVASEAAERTAQAGVAARNRALARITSSSAVQQAGVQAKAGGKYKGGLKGRVTPPVAPKVQADRASALNSLSEASDKVLGPGWGDEFIRIRTLTDRQKGEQWKRLRDAGLTAMNEQEQEMLRQVLNGRLGMAQVPKRVRDVANEFRNQANLHANFFRRVGQRIYDPHTKKWVAFQAIPNYSPRVLDFAKLEKISVSQLIQELQALNPGLTGQQIVALANGLKAAPQNIGKLKLMERVQKGLGPTHLRLRNAPELPSSILRDMKTSIAQYLEDSAKEIAVAQHFGPNDKAFMQALLKSNHPDKELLWEGYQKFRGWDRPAQLVKPVATAGRIANNLAAAMFLKVSTAVKQVSQVVPTWAKTGTKHMAIGLGRMMTKAGRDQAEIAGAFTNDLADAAFGAIRASNVPGMSGKLIRGTGKAAELTVKYTGTTAVDRFVRGVAYHAKLSELKMLDKAGKLKKLQSAGVNTKAPSRAIEMEMVAKEFADKMNLRTDIVSSPMLLSSEGLQFMRGLQMFAINQSKMLYKEFLRPTLRPESFQAWADQMVANVKFGAYAGLVGELINDTLAFLTNKKRPKSTAKRLAENWAVVGTLGIVQPITIGLWSETGPQTGRGIASQMVRNVGQVASGVVTGAGPRAVAEPVVAAGEAAMGRPRRAARLLPIIGDVAQGYLTPPQTRGTGRQRRRRRR